MGCDAMTTFEILLTLLGADMNGTVEVDTISTNGTVEVDTNTTNI